MVNLVIVEWRNTENWADIVLSRVKTLAGIFLLEALPEYFSFAPAPEYLSMMERLRSTILTTEWDNMNLVIAKWHNINWVIAECHNTENWAYVVLSRAKT